MTACGGGGKVSLPEPPADADVVVTAFDIGIREKTLPDVKAGDVKFFYRDEGTSHTLRVKDAGGKDAPGFQLVVDKPGDSDEGSVKLDPGEYIAYCSIPGHYATMHRTLTVT
jgi:uncharacterized cupredoxin-like copper-binding protein